MRVLPKSAKVLTILSLGFLSTQVLAQNFCSTTGHSGTGRTVSGSYVTGSVGNYDFQLWYDHAQSGSATFYNEGSMSCSFQGAGDYLCRMGLQFNSDKTYDQLGGDIMAEFKLVKQNISGVGYSYVGVYGWMEGVSGAPNGLVEYYVVDNTLAQYMPGDWVGDTKKGDYTIDGAVYTVYRNTRFGPAIGGNNDREFHQYFSVRKSARDCGTINVSAHIKKWKELGMADGKLYEAKVLGEAGCTGNGCGVSGTADFPVARVYIGNGSTPTSSSSVNNPASSSAVVNPVEVTNIPGTVELENFATSGGDEVTVYGNIVGEIKPGAWLEYPISVTSAGVYTVNLLAARQDDQNRTTTVDISVDGKSVASITGILTTGWNDYDSFTAETTNLTAGSHTLRVTFTGGYVNVDNLKFTKKTTASSSSAKQSSSSANQSSSSVKQSSSSAKLSSSSALVQSSSSAQVESSASVESSSSALEISSATAESSSSSEVSSSAMEISSSAIGESSSSVGQWYSSATMAMAKTRFSVDGDRNLQVFDMQGRFLGRVTVAQGVSMEQALRARFQKPGIYLVKQGGRFMQVRVTR
ncbi:glycoside hydrolase family 11 protein [Fibrobacter sp.]|uniref:glycoside hydrolase family 11 protein n=1 Tax=Fibrobacter sp. TaxID=35828 RepID=UPI00388E9E4C